VAELSILISAASDGDAAAWRTLVERFSGLVWSVARGHGLAHADAEEVFQTTWFRFTQHIDRIKEPDRVGGWLATTARREALRIISAGQRIDPTDDFLLIDERSPEQAVLDAEDFATDAERLRRVWEVFEELPDRCRSLLRVLLAVPPPSYTEIASAFEMAVGSIGPTRARCLRQLRSLLAARGVTGGVDG
jgi:RNA polymerase sigma factor (sigma-70 family)